MKSLRRFLFVRVVMFLITAAFPSPQLAHAQAFRHRRSSNCHARHIGAGRFCPPETTNFPWSPQLQERRL